MLARPAGECELWRERRYLLPLDDGTVERGAFDRVVVIRDGARPVGARLVDYKSDAGLDDAARLDERAAHHAVQLSLYRAALARILDLGSEAITAELWFLEPDVVRAV
jgi:hypothetical protein